MLLPRTRAGNCDAERRVTTRYIGPRCPARASSIVWRTSSAANSSGSTAACCRSPLGSRPSAVA